MLAKLKTFLAPSDTATPVSAHDDVQLAAASLLCEAAMIDGQADDAEKAQIREVLAHLFNLPEAELDSLIAEATTQAKGSIELYGFARAVKDAFDYDKRVELVSMLWEVVLADGRVDDYEANLVRRVSGLLYVTDQDSGRARKSALAQLGMDG